MARKELKVVIAGCGGISELWMDFASKTPAVKIVGLVDINEASAQAKKDKFAFADAEIGTDLKTLLKLKKPDVVFDCSIPGAHMPITLTALKAGCHVLGEKPMADSLENAKKMVAAARKTGLTYAVMQNRRFDANIRTFSQFLAKKGVGDLTTLHSTFLLGAHFGGFRDRMEHVLLVDMAIHTFDAARLISGADPVGVFCKEWNPKGSWYDHDASAVCMFEMSDGIVYTYRGSWCSEGLNTTWEADWHAIGTRGSASWDGANTFKAERIVKDEGFVRTMGAADVGPVVPLDASGHGGWLKHSVDCLLKGRQPETVCTDNIKSLAMVFGAVESAETNKYVKIKV